MPCHARSLLLQLLLLLQLQLLLQQLQLLQLSTHSNTANTGGRGTCRPNLY